VLARLLVILHLKRLANITNKASRHQTAVRLLLALTGVQASTVLVSGFVRALLAFGFLSSNAKRLSSPVCGFAANGGGGSVVLRGFA
jgi:hypothetical protein